MLKLFLLIILGAGILTASQWDIHTILKQESLTQLQIAPAEDAAVWVKRYPDMKANVFKTDIFLTRVVADSFLTLQLTRSGKDRSPRWSPDGQWIAFLSNRELPESTAKGKTQVWLMRADGGEPFPLTRLESGVQRFRWLNDTAIVFSARENPTFFEKERKKQKDDANVVEDTTQFWPVRLFVVNTQTQRIRRLTTNRFRIQEFAPSPDGQWIVYSVQTHPITADARHQPRQYLLHLPTGNIREIFARQYFDPSNFQWRADSRGFYAWDEYASDPWNEGAGINLLYYYNVENHRYQKIPLKWKNGVGFAGFSAAGNGVHVQLADGPRYHPRYYWYENGQWHFRDVRDERLRHATSVISSASGRTIVFVYSRPNQPPVYLWASYRNGQVVEAREFVQLNAFLKQLPQPRAEVITWKGARGETVNGILYYPLNYQPGRRYPLIVSIHGGPSGVDLDAWRQDWVVYPAIWTQKGAFVLRPNYHGSGNHGLEFVESIKGHYYELEIPDILNGIQHLIRQGLVHPDSLGVKGWSNGAILTIALTVEKPQMFKAAVPGAGDVNWISDYGNCAFGVRFDNSYFKGPPWKYLKHYIKKSPLFRMERVVTPTLIFFGTEDTSVPTEQGWQHYRALQQIGKAPVRFILFPGEAHGLRKISHQRRKMEEEIRWFDRYLFKRFSPEKQKKQTLIAKNAPLWWHDQQVAAATHNGLKGVLYRGKLIPEMVPVNDTLAVSRFEITVAQLAAFDSTYQYLPPQGNLPAAGVDSATARAYIQWLRQLTGRAFRLPTEQEFKQWQRQTGTPENNLAYWAGHSPNPDEFKQLQTIVQQYATQSFLKPVGSFAPALIGKPAAAIFDLNGNVAEWVQRGNQLVPAGNCAITVTDSRTKHPYPPPPSFIGFRVVEVLSGQ